MERRRAAAPHLPELASHGPLSPNSSCDSTFSVTFASYWDAPNAFFKFATGDGSTWLVAPFSSVYAGSHYANAQRLISCSTTSPTAPYTAAWYNRHWTHNGEDPFVSLADHPDGILYGEGSFTGSPHTDLLVRNGANVFVALVGANEDPCATTPSPPPPYRPPPPSPPPWMWGEQGQSVTTFVGLKFAIENGSAPLITVTADLSFTGQILVTRAVSVVGAKPSGGKAVFDAGSGCRHFFVDVPGGFVSIENAELTGGYAAPNLPGGGAVHILHGDVQFASTRFAYNVAAGAGMYSGAGGAVLFDEGFTGSANFIDCAFISNNGGNSVGGAIGMYGPGTYTVTRCLFFDNAVYRCVFKPFAV